MLHWAKAFAMIAVIASAATLAIYPSPLGVLALFMTAVFVTLSFLSLITGAFGRRRDSWSYSATQALACVALLAGALWAGQHRLAHGWTAADLASAVKGLG